MGVVFGVVIFIFGIAQFVAGYQGIAYELGPWWAFGGLFLAFALRFTLPITIGSFFGAWHVWHWHWALALLFAAPGLLLVTPALVAGAFGKARAVFR